MRRSHDPQPDSTRDNVVQCPPQVPERDALKSEDATLPSPLPDDVPLLTVIIPAFNEVRTIDELLRRVLAAPYDKQVIVVDDCSTDGTAEALDQWEGGQAVEVLHHGRNQGKGAAIRTGLQHAQGRFTIIQDADLEYDPLDYPKLVEPLLTGQAQVAYGSRYLCTDKMQGKPTITFRYGVSLLNYCVRLLYGIRLTDEATCYKVFPTEVLRSMDLECERFEFCPEVTAKVCRMGLTIHEVPISYHVRSRADGKKIRLSDGWEAVRVLWKWRKWKPPMTEETTLSSEGTDCRKLSYGHCGRTEQR